MIECCRISSGAHARRASVRACVRVWVFELVSQVEAALHYYGVKMQWTRKSRLLGRLARPLAKGRRLS